MGGGPTTKIVQKPFFVVHEKWKSFLCESDQNASKVFLIFHVYREGIKISGVIFLSLFAALPNRCVDLFFAAIKGTTKRL